MESSGAAALSQPLLVAALGVQRVTLRLGKLPSKEGDYLRRKEITFNQYEKLLIPQCPLFHEAILDFQRHRFLS